MLTEYTKKEQVNAVFALQMPDEALKNDTDPLVVNMARAGVCGDYHQTNWSSISSKQWGGEGGYHKKIVPISSLQMSGKTGPGSCIENVSCSLLYLIYMFVIKMIGIHNDKLKDVER